MVCRPVHIYIDYRGVLGRRAWGVRTHPARRKFVPRLLRLSPVKTRHWPESRWHTWQQLFMQALNMAGLCDTRSDVHLSNANPLRGEHRKPPQTHVS